MSHQNDCCPIVHCMALVSSPILAKSPMPKDASMGGQTRQHGSNLAGKPTRQSSIKIKKVNCILTTLWKRNICSIIDVRYIEEGELWFGCHIKKQVKMSSNKTINMQHTNKSCMPLFVIAASKHKTAKINHHKCLRPYHVENASSRPITEAKQRRAQLVLGWVTAWEYWVL